MNQLIMVHLVIANVVVEEQLWKLRVNIVILHVKVHVLVKIAMVEMKQHSDIERGLAEQDWPNRTS